MATLFVKRSKFQAASYVAYVERSGKIRKREREIERKKEREREREKERERERQKEIGNKGKIEQK